MNEKLIELADDIALEIVIGTDRFDKADVDWLIDKNNINKADLKNAVMDKVLDYGDIDHLSDKLMQAIEYWCK